jgi:hypothetical protein
MSGPSRTALKRWQSLSSEQQQTLLRTCTQGYVIELPKEGEAKVVSVFFGMDVSIGSKYEYIFPDEVTK